MSEILSKIPAFKESRLRSLYSDFSHLNQVNPEGFDANVQAWCDALDQCLTDHYFQSTITIPGSDLESKFTNADFGKPKGLATVLDIQVQNGHYVPWSIYKVCSPEPSWGFRDYLSPMRWIERRLRSFRVENFSALDGKGGVGADYFISWEKLAEVGDKMSQLIKEEVEKEGTYSAKLLDSDLFVDLVRRLDRNLSDLDIQVLLIYLSRDTNKLKVISDYENARRAFVKVDTAGITNEDISIIKVKANIRSLQARTDILAERLDKEIPAKILELLKKGKQDDRLKNVLVQKTYVTRSLNKSLGVMSQLNMILDKINDAQANVSVYETLKTAKDVLATFNNMISFADLDKVQLELDEEIAISNELTEAMVISPDLDERTIDDELEELEKEFEKEKKEKEKEKDEKEVEVKSEETKEETEVESEEKTVEEKEQVSEPIAQSDENLIDRLEALKLDKTAPLTETPAEPRKEEEQASTPYIAE